MLTLQIARGVIGPKRPGEAMNTMLNNYTKTTTLKIQCTQVYN